MYERFIHRFYSLPRAEIGYLRFLLEGYDGMAFARTLDPRAGLVEIAFPASRQDDVQALLVALAQEIALVEVPRPPVVPPL